MVGDRAGWRARRRSRPPGWPRGSAASARGYRRVARPLPVTRSATGLGPSRRLDDDDGARDVVGDLVGDAAEEQALRAAHPLVADHDRVGADRGGDVDDGVARVVLDGVCLDGQPLAPRQRRGVSSTASILVRCRRTSARLGADLACCRSSGTLTMWTVPPLMAARSIRGEGARCRLRAVGPDDDFEYICASRSLNRHHQRRARIAGTVPSCQVPTSSPAPAPRSGRCPARSRRCPPPTSAASPSPPPSSGPASPPDEVDHVIMGQVLMAGQGQVPSRQAAVKAGHPDARPRRSTSTRSACRASTRSTSPTR